MLNVLANIKWRSLYYDVESNGMTLGLANELRSGQNTRLVATSIGQNMFYIYLLTFFSELFKIILFCIISYGCVILPSGGSGLQHLSAPFGLAMHLYSISFISYI